MPQLTRFKQSMTDYDITFDDLISKAFGEGNLSEDILEKWINESKIGHGPNEGQVNYNKFLHKMAKQKKNKPEGFLYREIEQNIRAEFRRLDKNGTGFLTESQIKGAIIETLDKKFQEIINEPNVADENFETEDDNSSRETSSEPTSLETLPSPPDGGWGWVIVFACFMCNLIINGFRFGAFGVLLMPWQDDFKAPVSSLAWAGSLSCGLLSLLGPLIGGLINKFGLRPVCIFGSIIACIGLCLATLSPNVPVLIFTMGVIGGIGYGLVNLPSKVAIGYYFESKRALATGISETGSGFGTFVFSTAMTYFVETYDWKVAIFVMAALCFSCITFGALMRPLELVHKEPEKKENQPKNIKQKIERALIPVTSKWPFSKTKPVIATPFSKRCVLYGGDVQNLVNDHKFPEWNGCKNILLFKPSDHNNAPNSEKGGFWIVHKPKEAILPIWVVLKEMINVELLANPRFLFFGISVFFGILGLYVPYAYLPSLAMDCIEDLDMKNATFLLSVIGIANIVGKLLTGWLSDFSWVSTQTLSNVHVLLCGIAVFSMSFCVNSYAAFVITAVVFGFSSSYVILKTIVLVELLGLEKLTSSFGLLGLFEGFACLIGTPIGGAVFDATKSFIIPFYMAGGFFILASIFGFLAQILHNRQNTTSTNV